jgi:hypothetical protein
VTGQRLPISVAPGPFHFVPMSPEVQKETLVRFDWRFNSELPQLLSKQPPAWIREYNECMNCQVKDELVSQLVALNNKLNLLSPDLVHGDEKRAEVQQQRENLYAAIKHHRAKGHEGKPCPAARQV